MADVFVSYKSHRRAAVEHLARVLELNGYSVWFDHALLAGEEFAPPIERELRAARAVIVTWCSLSIVSDWVREEASLAKRLKTILPVRLERVDLPLGFATLHTIDLSRWDGSPRSHVVDRLALEVGRLVGRDPAPDVRGLLDYERIWRRSGGPSIAQLSQLAPVPPAPAVPDTAVPAAAGAPAAKKTRTKRDGASESTGAAVAEVAVPRPAHGLPASTRVTESPAPAQTGQSSDQADGVGATLANHRQRQKSLVLPTKTSLVVLPFAIIGDDPEQVYFADGLTEELTSELSRLGWFFVIARNSAFTYKGKVIDVREIGRDLGVRYVLEGSVRRAGRQVRISGRLVDAETGNGIWTGRFDGDIDEIFELQDRVTEAVAGALDPTLRSAEIERAHRKPPRNLDAYDLYLRALPHYHAMSEAGTAQAQALLQRALALSPATHWRSRYLPPARSGGRAKDGPGRMRRRWRSASPGRLRPLRPATRPSSASAPSRSPTSITRTGRR